jgi:hypothetical protein
MFKLLFISNFFIMTDTYLRSLGFAPVQPETRASRAAFAKTWRYRYDHEARDGAHLYIEHPLGISSCRLSALAAPLAAQDIFATLDLHDRAGLEAAISAFYSAHGGMGAVMPSLVTPGFRPFRREQ